MPVVCVTERTYDRASLKQSLLDRIDELLKKINFDKELIESYDKFFKNQSVQAESLRSDLHEISIVQDDIKSPLHSVSRDFNSIFVQTEQLADTDVPNSVEMINEDNTVLPSSPLTDEELFAYLLDREREILQLQCSVACQHSRGDTLEYCQDNELSSSVQKIEEFYIQRYWKICDKNKKLKDQINELKVKEQSLQDQLQEQEQLTIFYAYLNHSSEKSQEQDLSEDSESASE